MKKVFIALAVIIVLAVGGIAYVYLNLDQLVEDAIETAGSRALGTPVAVGRVSLDLPGGTAAIYDFSVANPEGFTQGDMVRFAELSVGLDILNISAESIHITSVVSRDPYVLYESSGGTTNFDTLLARFDSGEPAEPVDNTAAQPRVIIDSILVQNISGTLMDDRLPAPVAVNLGDIELANLDGKPADLASQIMDQVLRQIARAAGQALLRETSKLLTDPDALRNRVEEGRRQLENAASEALGDLFGGGDDEEVQ